MPAAELKDSFQGTPLVGQSPFRLKGTIWLSARAYLDERVPGGCAAVEERLPADVRAYFSQLFVPLGWYDALPVNAITAASAAALGVPTRDFVRAQAAWKAQQDMRGIYKLLLKLSSPTAVWKRFGSIYSQFYDFGRLTFEPADKDSVDSCVHGMPAELAEWWMQATESYMTIIMQAAGAKSVRNTWKTPEADGSLCGVRLVRIRVNTTWR